MASTSPKYNDSITVNYPRALSSIIISVGLLAVFITLASWMLLSNPIETVVQGYFYGVDRTRNVDLPTVIEGDHAGKVRIDGKLDLGNTGSNQKEDFSLPSDYDKKPLIIESDHVDEVRVDSKLDSGSNGSNQKQDFSLPFDSDKKSTIIEGDRAGEVLVDNKLDSGSTGSNQKQDFSLPSDKDKKHTIIEGDHAGEVHVDSKLDSGSTGSNQKQDFSSPSDNDKKPNIIEGDHAGEVRVDSKLDSRSIGSNPKQDFSLPSDNHKKPTIIEGDHAGVVHVDSKLDSGSIGSNPKQDFSLSSDNEQKPTIIEGDHAGEVHVDSKLDSGSTGSDQKHDFSLPFDNNKKPDIMEVDHAGEVRVDSKLDSGSIGSNPKQDFSLPSDNEEKPTIIEGDHAGEVHVDSKLGSGSSGSNQKQDFSLPSDNDKNPTDNGSNGTIPTVLPKSETSLHPVSRKNSADSECDLYHGEWFYDSAGPTYTNNTCPVITQMQNCQGNGRPDKGYENWRWKPSQCELPRFNGTKFLELMSGKTIAFVGDSVARNQMESLMCLLWQVETPKQRGNRRMQRWYFRSKSVMISRIWSSWLVHHTAEAFSDVPAGIDKVHLDVPDETFMQFISTFDVIVLSSGHWFSKKSVYMLNNEIVGTQLWSPPNKQIISKINNVEAFGISVETSLTAMLQHPNFTGLTILRSFSPDHYEGGAWNTGGSCTGKEAPLFPGQLLPNEFVSTMHEQQVNGLSRAIKKQTNRSKVRFMDITEIFSYRHDGHPGPYRSTDPNKITKRDPLGKPPPQDCLHWCMPGAVDTWNEFVLEIIKREFEGKQNPSS